MKSPKDIFIRTYTPSDRKAFYDLNVEWITKHFVLENADRMALDDPEKYILKNGGHIAVAELCGEVVGVCALLKREDPTYTWELAKMAVSPKAQGKGAGFLLGKAIAEKAQALGAKQLYLESNSKLKPAIGLYKKLGFKEVQGVKTPYDRCNIQMVMDL